MDYSKLNEITFICTDKVEYHCCEPIIEEAKKRGYKTKVTDNKFEKCEIGFYLSHWNFPKHSKLSIVSLHDLGQQHGEWPCIWKIEYWNIFDVGLLPSKEWCDMWQKSSCYKFARPRIGTFFTGWSKSDRIYEKSFKDNCLKIIRDYGIDINKKTILYAPSWEWDNRQLEMIESVKDLNVNLLIKQFPYMKTDFPEQYEIIKRTHELSKNKPNVFILDSSINIYDAINLCDVLVSEESSTLYEAMLLEKPVIAVSDWLVPDVKPPRLPDFPYDFAVHTEKKNLTECVSKVLTDSQYLEKIRNYRKENFPQLGNSAKNVMDVIDGIVKNNGKNISQLKIKESEKIDKTPKEFKKSVNRRKWVLFKQEFAHNTILGKILFAIYKKIKCLSQ